MLTFSYPQAILTGIYQTIGTIDRFHFSPESIEQCTTHIPKVPKRNEPLRDCKFLRFSFDMPNIFKFTMLMPFFRLAMWPLGIFVTSTSHTHFYSCLWFYTNMIYEPQCTIEKNWSWRNAKDLIVSIHHKQSSHKESKNQAYHLRWNIFYIKTACHIEQVKFNMFIMIGRLFFTTHLD
jgi:hypothetical protein